jgi:hypothetical protein
MPDPILMLPPGVDGLCSRCSAPLRLGDASKDRKASMMRLSEIPQGVCATCAFRGWLAVQAARGDGIGAWTPEMFLRPEIQRIAQNLFRASGSVCDVREIDWERLVVQWDLPLSEPRKRKRGKHA